MRNKPMRMISLVVAIGAMCTACDSEVSPLGPPVQAGEVVSKIETGDRMKFSQVREAAKSAELAVDKARKAVESPVNKAGYKRTAKDASNEFEKLTSPQQRAFAALMSEIRTDLPVNINPDNIDVYLKGDELAFAMPGVEIREMRTLRKFDEDGAVSAERVGILQEQVPNYAKEEQVLLPANRGFTSTSRHIDGRYSWRHGDLGSVRIYWQKDFVNETGSWGDSPDWMVYSAWTRATANDNSWWQPARYIYDIDTINGVASGSDWAHIQDNGYEVHSAPSGCSVVEIGASWGGIGMAVPVQTCARTSVKGDRVGGKHVEFRNDRSLILNNVLIKDKDFAAGYSQEVKTHSNYAMYWWDYGDACFTKDYGGVSLTCDEEVEQ
jgi:hypothetical protein